MGKTFLSLILENTILAEVKLPQESVQSLPSQKRQNTLTMWTISELTKNSYHAVVSSEDCSKTGHVQYLNFKYIGTTNIGWLEKFFSPSDCQHEKVDN